MTRILPSVDESNFNHWAWFKPDGKVAGPFGNHFLADKARHFGGGGGYLMRCSAVGVILPEKQADGTYRDMGDIHNPPVPTFEEKITMDKKIDDIKHGTSRTPARERPVRCFSPLLTASRGRKRTWRSSG